jgi:hypothetical protein
VADPSSPGPDPTDAAQPGIGDADPAAEDANISDTGTGHTAEPVPGTDLVLRPRGDLAGSAAGTTDVATRHDADPAAAGRGLTIYGDCAYGTGEARAASLAGGHDVVIKPKPLTSGARRVHPWTSSTSTRPQAR